MITTGAAGLLATALGHAANPNSTPVRLEYARTTNLVTYVPEDLESPFVAELPSGYFKVSTSSAEQLVTDHLETLQAVAAALPVNAEADQALGQLLTSIQAKNEFESLDEPYGE